MTCHEYRVKAHANRADAPYLAVRVHTHQNAPRYHSTFRHADKGWIIGERCSTPRAAALQVLAFAGYTEPDATGILSIPDTDAPQAFADLLTDRRIFLRSVCDLFGAAVAGYHGPGFTVKVSNRRDYMDGLRTALEAAGYTVTADTYWPIGGDAPPAGLRHGMPWKYPNMEPGFTRHWTVRPAG